MFYFENARFDPCDGYGSFSTNLIEHLMLLGENIKPVFTAQVKSNNKLINKLTNFDSDQPLISCIPPGMLNQVSNPRYLYTMCECDKLPDYWINLLSTIDYKKIFVPSQYCHDTFKRSGFNTTIILGGTNPKHFPVIKQVPNQNNRPYTFLLLADRAMRKGWIEAWDAFFIAFNDNSDVRVIVKYREDKDARLLNKLASSKIDSRITFLGFDVADMNDVYNLVDCVVLPSYAEGWGMPHREAAMCGLPVITLKYSGLDDGNIEQWSLPVKNYKLFDVDAHPDLAGQYALPDVEEIAHLMKHCFDNRVEMKTWAVNRAATWLRNNQTWDITASKLRSELYA